jgi:hypothetical protein
MIKVCYMYIKVSKWNPFIVPLKYAKKKKRKWGMMISDYNPSTWDTETGGL